MMFWIGILVGGLFVWIAFQIGFYQVWTMLFNILISVYLAVYLGPEIAALVPGAGDTAYSDILGMIAVGVGTFAILQCISYTFLTGQFTVTFPRIFEFLGVALVGFVAGYLVWSFVGLLIAITPVSKTNYAKWLGFGTESQKTNLRYLAWSCEQVNKIVASKDHLPAEKRIKDVLARHEKLAPSDSNEPNSPGAPTI